MIGRPFADVPIWRSRRASGEVSEAMPRYWSRSSSGMPVMGSPASSWTTAVAR